MAWYSQPIKPFDPLNPEDAPMQPERYLRDTFTGSGQDSHTLPPAQDAGQWQSLFNVMPITAGILTQRWGYNTFATASGSGNNWLTNFQRDSDGLRTLIASSTSNVEAFTESGTVYNAAIFNPAAPGAIKVRSLTSRSFQYFFDGYQADLVKWNGNNSGGVTNWGISMINNTGALVSGPNPPTNIASSSGWASPANIELNDGSFTTYTVSSGGFPAALTADHFGFAGIPGGATITGIEVDLKGKCTSIVPPAAPITIFLVKAGTPTGSSHLVNLGTTNTFSTAGGSTDLWGTSWLPSDFNGVTSFGVLIDAQAPFSGSVTYSLDFVQIKVFYNGNLSAITDTPTGIGTGNITLTVGRIYYCAFNNSSTGHFSDLNAASGSTGPLSNQNVNLTTIPVSSDAQVDYKVILATADGGDPSILYFVALIPNASTTYTDSTPDPTLVFNQEYLFTDQFGQEFGLALNTPPPNGTLAIKHQGRLWMAQGQNIFFSKSVADLTLPNGFIAGKYEEAWPGDSYFDISQGAETVSGLLSDGTTLYIGTQNHIRRLLGSDPTNFQAPQIIHPEVGLLNQDVWQLVYREGTPAGCMWLTPDFRVIGSDFNTYTDVGRPVQDVLNNIQLGSTALCHAMFVYDGEFDLYILSIPVNQTTYCDTHLVYNMRDGHWVVWQTANGSSMSFFNLNAVGGPQWLFVGGTTSNTIYQFQQTDLTDAGTLITVSASTSWMHLGSPTAKKVLDEIEILGDTGTLVTIQGANNKQDFAAPFTVISNAPLVLSPFGQWKVFLPTQTSKYRYYQFTFSTTDTNFDFIGSYNIRFVPWNTL